MPQQIHLPEVQVLPDRLDVLDHVLDGVTLRVFQLPGLPGAALVDEHDAIGPRERQQIRQEVVVGCARTAVQDQQWLSVAERLVVDEDAVGVHEAGLNLQGRRSAPPPAARLTVPCMKIRTGPQAVSR
jgi:hypothetical protein